MQDNPYLMNGNFYRMKSVWFGLLNMSNLLPIPDDKNKIVESILKAKDLYKICHVTRDATTEEIKKQYKKLSVHVHPDKNPHPKADDAFKSLSAAKRVLEDGTMRRRYDQTGSTSERPTPQEFFRPGFNRSPFDDMDIFEFLRRAAEQQEYGSRSRRSYSQFNDFSSGSFHFHHQEPRRSTEAPNASTWVSLFLMLLSLLAFTFLLSRSSTSTPEFSLWKTDVYTVQHLTLDGLPFWLEPEKFTSSQWLDDSFRKSLDNRVLNSWLQFKRQECNQELYRRSASLPRPQSCLDSDYLSGKATRAS